MIFLDYNSTTPLDPLALEAMMPWFSKQFANEASQTHAPGWQARKAVDLARQEMAALLECEEEELIFTSGATESALIALWGLWESYGNERNEILISSTEHAAVLNAAASLSAKGGILRFIPCNHQGNPSMEFIQQHLSEKTLALVMMHANNETGTIHPVKELSEKAHAFGAFFVCDATQSIGKISCTVPDTGADLMFASAHKFHGPKGTGFLFLKRKNPRVQLTPLLPGSGQERGLRHGTLNVPGIVGMQKAFSLSCARIWEFAAHTSVLRTYLEQYLELHTGAAINGDMKNRLPNTTNVFFPGLRVASLIKKTPTLAFSAGSACTSALPAPSHVLLAMGKSEEESYGCARFSLSQETTRNEIEEAARLLAQACKELS
jgi:cysteine desulfurase